MTAPVHVYLQNLRRIRCEEIAKREHLFKDLDEKIKEAAKTENHLTYSVDLVNVQLFVSWCTSRDLQVSYSTGHEDKTNLIIRW